jgi:hypothetical protein
MATGAMPSPALSSQANKVPAELAFVMAGLTRPHAEEDAIDAGSMGL